MLITRIAINQISGEVKSKGPSFHDPKDRNPFLVNNYPLEADRKDL